MGDTNTDEHPNGLSNGFPSGYTRHAATKKKPKWQFDTIQVHAGLEDAPKYGHCTLPIYNTASFKFATSAALDEALGDIASSQNHLYSRVSNVSYKPKELGWSSLIRGRSRLMTDLRNE